MGDCPSAINTFHFGTICSNGMIAQAGILFHAVSSSLSDSTTFTTHSAGSPHNAVKVFSVESSIRSGIPLKGPDDAPLHAERRSCVLTPSTRVGKGATSAYVQVETCAAPGTGCT